MDVAMTEETIAEAKTIARTVVTVRTIDVMIAVSALRTGLSHFTCLRPTVYG